MRQEATTFVAALRIASAYGLPIRQDLDHTSKNKINFQQMTTKQEIKLQAALTLQEKRSMAKQAKLEAENAALKAQLRVHEKQAAVWQSLGSLQVRWPCVVGCG